ncbi:hypothetical protein X747_29055 [Mesorhizobium sp. LNJC384A00]|uniref:alpha/beta hydrolase n=1 Tax=unclassified Mesorhizobium TaxID=325217 RepID=UPI0003CF4F24|nr:MULTISPECIES: alpha/beta hydrolase [unclassified Mesorhizobium]ESX20345.1 hypothetical protein X766_08995 [Mesorhizobium sp. LSJC255A00]ESX78448.1 hypothetical protein X757_08210 [Mesorhizobium sp. LSHC414A00]ESY34679.1 hypothetical protein X747_29055 [Mesorhizobium sp. LNJC384A00]
MEELGGLAGSPQRVVVTVHGIRTFGQWQDRLRDLIHKRAPDVIVEPFRYGYFSALAFAFPFFRWLAVLFFRARLRDLIRRHPDARFVFVAHSFGTHLTMHGLKGLRKAETPRIDLIILAGSVLRPSFNWPRFMEKVPARQVVNDCGINDSVLILSQFVVLLTGMAGRVGFYGFTGGNVLNRFFVGGHGHYFASNRHDANHFMRTQWLSSIVDDARFEPVDQRPPFGVLGGLSNAAVRLSDPLKLVLYGALIWFTYDAFYRQPRLELIAEQASREVTVAATAMETDFRMPTSYQSALHVLRFGGQIHERDRALADKVVRYSGQRLATFADAFKALEPNSVFRWSGSSYAATNAPLRLPGAPAWYARVGESKRLLTIDADSTIALVDTVAGRVISRQRIGDAGESTVLGTIDVLSLKGDANLIGLKFSVSRPNDEDVSHYAATVQADSGTITAFGGDDTPTNFTATPGCKSFQVARDIDDDDDDDLTADQLKAAKEQIRKESEIAARCIVKSAANVAQPLIFPTLVPETGNWQVTNVTNAPRHDEDLPAASCQNLSGHAKFPYVVLQDANALDFSKASGQEGLDRERLENLFRDPDTGEGPCYLEFQGAGGKKFALANGPEATWYGNFLICEILGRKTIGKCDMPAFAWNGSGEIQQSPDGNLLAITSFGSSESEAWSLTDLRTMTTIGPEDPAFGHVSAIAFGADSRTVAVAGPLEGVAGAVRLVIYDLGDPILPLASRVIESSARPEPLTGTENPLYNVSLFRSGGGFVLATGYGDVVGFRVTDYSSSPGLVARLSEWLYGASSGSASITFDWLANPVGFSPQGNIRYDFEPGQGQLLAYDQERVRLLDTTGGYMLTSIAKPAEQPGCNSPIRTAEILADGRISIQTGTCDTERKAPLNFEATSQMGDHARAPELADGRGHQELPRERTAE